MNDTSRFHAIRSVSFRTLSLLPLLAVCASGLSAATYWIDYAAGRDTATGTTAGSAWQHCPGDPAATGGPAAAILAPGDTVVFKGGVSYVLTAGSGLSLSWNGQSGAPITYDGNSAGTWGTGPAVITDQFGSSGLTALAGPSGSSTRWVVIRGLTFSGIGGSPVLPPDTGAPLAARYGGGIAFPGGASDVSIEDCVFRQLGYAFNQRPVASSSLAGTAVTLAGAARVSVLRCDFSRLTTGIDFTGSGPTGVSVSACVFHDAVVRPFKLTVAQSAGVQIWSCAESDNTQHEPANWTGYGDSPRLVRETVAAGGALRLSASASALPGASYQWFKDGVPLAGATSATLDFTSLVSTDAADYTVLATNAAGNGLSNHILVEVTAAPPPVGDVPPAFVTQPAGQTAPAGSSVTFSVTVSGSPAPTVVWFRDGLTFNGWTGTSLTLAGVSSNDAGNYRAVATNSAGSATSATATLSIGASTPSATAPVFTVQPQGVTAAAKSTVSFTASASGTPAPTYQWRKDGAAITGATAAKLTLTNINKGSAGTYTVVAANSAGSVVSNPATLTVTSGKAAAPLETAVAAAESPDAEPAPPAPAGTLATRLVNVSVRTFLPAGRDGTALGFVVEGPQPRRILLRAIGPSLSQFGVADALANPKLEVHRAGTRVDGNDDWSGSAALHTAFNEAGAFPLSDPASHDAALVLLADPGAYTVTCADAARSAGTVLIEIYELP